MRQQQTWSRIGAALLLVTGVAAAAPARAQAGKSVTIPVDTVVRLKTETRLNSGQAKKGDLFAAVLSPEDRSGFPTGARFQGEVLDVQRYAEDRPGILDMRIRRAFLPDGQKVNLDGRLASLAVDDVRRLPDGRLEAKKAGKKMEWKWAGYGAGAGAVLASVFGGKILKGVLLGGVGGAIYGYLNRKSPREAYRDVDLPRGTEFGMRLNQQVAFADRAGYRYAGRAEEPETREPEERVAGARAESRYGDAAVRLNGEPVDLDRRPVELNGVLYVPLEPVAKAAGMRVSRTAAEASFTLHLAGGWARAYPGDASVVLGSGETVALEQPPVSLDGEIFVSPEYLGRVAGLRADWDAVRMRLDLETLK
jgi:hypothetical protein